MNKLTVNRITRLALLTAAGIALHIAEGLLPPIGAVPGGKLGLANVVTVMVLYLYGGRAALCVTTVRALLASLLTGGGMTMIYALAGAICSCAVMIAAKRLPGKRLSPIGVSVLGAAAHNGAQVAVAAVALRTSALVPYLAILLLISALSGTAVGIAAQETIKQMEKRTPERVLTDRREE